MKAKRRFPLLAKVAVWLAVHLLVLAVAFAAFVGWQLRLGLDSLLTGATGERLESLGTVISTELEDADETEWGSIIEKHISPFGLQGYLRQEWEMRPEFEEVEIPDDVMDRAKKKLPPPPAMRRPEWEPHAIRTLPDGSPLGRERRPPRRDGPPDDRHRSDSAKALFLAKGDSGTNYWAALEIWLPEGGRGRMQHGVLFLKSGNAAANGLFFDYRPWLSGGLAVLALSIAMWTPFVLGITRYAGRISRATGKIADGNFDTKIGASRNDELGMAGESIEDMSARLGHLISGQKRFLGDVSHELCAPLARIRTGLGILRNGADGRQAERLDSIEEDAEELSALVAELLAFTKANSTAVSIEAVPLADLCRDLIARELDGHTVGCTVPDGLSVKADRKLLTRAIQNIMRNCHRHAGPDCEVGISTSVSGNTVTLLIEDDGPGVAAEELAKLFEPFYRPDKSRTRDTGGTGLGMAIVESSVRASGGKVSAEKSAMGGLCVRMVLAKDGSPEPPASPPPRPLRTSR